MLRTIVHITDNSLDPVLAGKCQTLLVKAAGETPIISVSQKPISLGKNICVGEIGRSHLSLFKQLSIGVMLATTPIVVIAEHDCLYTSEHINWEPPTLDTFYYNNNQWFAQYGGRHKNLYTHMRRRVLSQLIVGRNIALDALWERVNLLEHGYHLIKGAAGACEPGCLDAEAFVKDPNNKDLGKDPTKWKAKRFSTQLPNLDIRHDQNFSGGRLGKDGTYSLPYWGTFAEVMNG